MAFKNSAPRHKEVHLLHFCEVHHSVVSSTDESFKDKMRLLLRWVVLVALSWLTLYTFVFTHITSVVKPVHFFMVRSRVSKNRFIGWASIAICILLVFRYMKIICGPNTSCFLRWWPLLGTRKLAPKKSNNNFFPSCILCKGSCHVHYFTVLIYLKTWRAAKLGILTHFMFTNLPRWSQRISSLKCVYSRQIPSCFLWVLDHHSRDQISSDFRKIFCITPCICIIGYEEVMYINNKNLLLKICFKFYLFRLHVRFLWFYIYVIYI